MKLIPILSIGLFNAWIPLILYSIIVFGLMLTFKKDIRKKFFDRSNIPRRYLPIVIIHKSSSLFLITLFFLSPIAINVPILAIGSFLFIVGISMVISAMLSFGKAPIDGPVVSGLYKFSRNPQDVGVSIVILSTCIMTNTISLLILFLIIKILSHALTLSEENQCLLKYGKLYEQYMKKVPRYFIF